MGCGEDPAQRLIPSRSRKGGIDEWGLLPEFRPAVSGPAVSGPAVCGPAVSGPAVSGPAVSGPAVSGPAVSGPAVSGPAGWRPISRVFFLVAGPGAALGP